MRKVIIYANGLEWCRRCWNKAVCVMIFILYVNYRWIGLVSWVPIDGLRVLSIFTTTMVNFFDVNICEQDNTDAWMFSSQLAQ